MHRVSAGIIWYIYDLAFSSKSWLRGLDDVIRILMHPLTTIFLPDDLALDMMLFWYSFLQIASAERSFSFLVTLWKALEFTLNWQLEWHTHPSIDDPGRRNYPHMTWPELPFYPWWGWGQPYPGHVDREWWHGPPKRKMLTGQKPASAVWTLFPYLKAGHILSLDSPQGELMRLGCDLRTKAVPVITMTCYWWVWIPDYSKHLIRYYLVHAPNNYKLLLISTLTNEVSTNKKFNKSLL